MGELLQTTILIEFRSILRYPPRVQDPAQFLFLHTGSSNQHGCTESLCTDKMSSPFAHFSQGARVRLPCSDAASAVVTTVGCPAVNWAV